MDARVLVVGGTGRLGRRIVRALAGRARVRATRRASAAPIDGVEEVVADLSDPDSLARACDGVDVVVSAVLGLREVIVDGQLRLLRAAEAAGVRRLIPSDFSVDLFATIEGQNRNLDLRRELGRALDHSTVRGTSVLCGAFMDLLLRPGAIAPDPSGAMRFWGDADQPYDFTSMDDTAQYTAAVALDPDPGRVVRVAGDTRSPRQLAAIFEEVRGLPVRLERAGSLEDLDRRIEALRAADPAPDDPFPVWQQLQYTRDMASGRGKLLALDNDRHPSVRPTGVREFLSARG